MKVKATVALLNDTATVLENSSFPSAVGMVLNALC